VRASSVVRALAVAVSICTLAPLDALAKEPLSLLEVQRVLAGKKFVDLTHEFAPGIPHWSGFPDEQRKTIYWYEKKPGMTGSGFSAEVFTHVG
jgi:hypothetical protein